MIFDSHCHLYDEMYKESPEEIAKICIDNGVSLMMVPGINIKTSLVSSELSKKFKEVYAAVGIHPENILDDAIDEGLILLEEMVHSNNKIKAIGEIGIDRHWTQDEQLLIKQKEYFIKQIDLANKLHLPIIVHVRDADGEAFNILKKHRPEFGAVIHCFSGSVELMQEYVKMGFYIGLDGPVTFKNAVTPKEVALNVPLENLLVETDAPYLTPVPKRGEINYPHYVKYVIEEIAKIKGIVPRGIEDTTYNNGIRLFGIK